MKIFSGAITIVALVGLMGMASNAEAAESYDIWEAQDNSAGSISVPTDKDALKCQKALAGGSAKFVKTLVKGTSKCIAKGEVGHCPPAKDEQKLNKAANKAVAKATKSCGSAGLSGLTNAYSTLTAAAADPGAEAAKCIIGQNDVSALRFVMATNGVSGVFSGAPGRDKCVKSMSKSSAKLMTTIHKSAAKCLLKGGDAAGCVGSMSSGGYASPSDGKTAGKVNKALGKAASGIGKTCSGTYASLFIPSLPGCPGAETTQDLVDCVTYASANAAIDLIEEAFNPNADAWVGSNVQAAIDAASAGDTVLVGPGTHAEALVVPAGKDGLSLIGCGSGADGDRPTFENDGSLSELNGITVIGVDNVTMQGLDFVGWSENGTFSSDSNNIAHIDIGAYDIGGMVYGIFPVQSTGVVVELSRIEGADDAGIYVGQSDDIVVRYNETFDNVAGIEIENSANAEVYSNLSMENTGGLAIFKLPGLPVQSGNDHLISHNVLVNNNRFNNGVGLVSAIPDGTGILMFSNDDCTIEWNIVTDNDSLGVAILDQAIINALVGGVFSSYSDDQSTAGNRFENNTVLRNGGNPDTTGGNATPLADNLIYIIDEGGPESNCFNLAGVASALQLFNPNQSFFPCTGPDWD